MTERTDTTTDAERTDPATEPGPESHTGPRTGTRADGSAWVSHGPARGTGTRPPFPEGNTLHLSHGAHSPRVYGAVARDLAAGLLDRRPDLAAYPDTVERWATASAISLLLRRHLDSVGVIDPETNKPRTALLARLAAEDNRAERTGMLLGLDPSSQARVARDRTATAHLAVDIEAILARGREANAAREAALTTPAEPDGLPGPPDRTDPADPVAALLAGVKADGRERWEAANAEHLASPHATGTGSDDESEEA